MSSLKVTAIFDRQEWQGVLLPVSEQHCLRVLHWDYKAEPADVVCHEAESSVSPVPAYTTRVDEGVVFETDNFGNHRKGRL